MDKFSTDTTWLVFYLTNKLFSVPSTCVREMVVMPKVFTIPQTPDYIRGMINIRGGVLPVIDLRLRMGMVSLVKETELIIQLLEQREDDHKNWISELEASVREQREFKLATDSHKCAFGKWYDNYKTENFLLQSCLKDFDEPHKRIHAIAIKVKEMEAKKDFDSAYEIINLTKNTELAEMIELFSTARSLLKETNREIALVLELEEKTIAISVDSVMSVEKLETSNIEDMPEVSSTTDNEFISEIGKLGKSDELVQILNVGKLIGQEKI
jgi:purine-binding chemotaxis protein CheW